MQGNGGGIGMWEAGTPSILNNVIRGNHGGGIGMVNYSRAQHFQNVIADNEGSEFIGWCRKARAARGYSIIPS